jgi:hypothetical protein
MFVSLIDFRCLVAGVASTAILSGCLIGSGAAGDIVLTGEDDVASDISADGIEPGDTRDDADSELDLVTLDGDAEQPDGDVDDSEVAVPDADADAVAEGCSDDSECPGDYACDTSGIVGVCFTSCDVADDDACKDTADCIGSVCEGQSAPEWVRVAIVFLTSDEESLNSATPGPDIDAIVLRRSDDELVYAQGVAALTNPRDLDSGSGIDIETAVLGPPDSVGDSEGECDLDETLY